MFALHIDTDIYFIDWRRGNSYFSLIAIELTLLCRDEEHFISDIDIYKETTMLLINPWLAEIYTRIF